MSNSFIRKLHKGEIHRQKEKALGNNVDSDSGSDMEIDSGFSVHGRIWNKLYRFAVLFLAAFVITEVVIWLFCLIIMLWLCV